MTYDETKPRSRCPICAERANVWPNSGPVERTVCCIRCGDFKAVRELIDDWPAHSRSDPRKVALASYVIRAMQGPTLSIFNLEKLERLMAGRSLPSPHEATHNLLLVIGNSLLGNPGRMFQRAREALIAHIGAFDAADIDYHCASLVAQRLADGREGGLRLTHAGWEKYDELKRTRADSKFAFFARKFANAELDRAVEEHFRPAVRKTGFELRIVPPKAGLIDAIIEHEIRRAKFLVADLSDQNAGAYWEAGFAEGLGKPVIYICKEGVEPHFDTEHRQTIKWRPDNAVEAAEKLKAVVRNTLLGDAIQED